MTSRWRPALTSYFHTPDTVYHSNSIREGVRLRGDHTKVKSQTTSKLRRSKTWNSSRSEQQKPNPAEFLSFAVRRLCSLLWRARSSSVRFRSSVLTHLLSSSAFQLLNGGFFLPSWWKPSQGRFRLMFLARFLFPCFSVRRNLCCSPTRLPHPAIGTVPCARGGGRSRSVWRSLALRR